MANRSSKRPGLKEIAKACGYSVNTVSDILNRGNARLYREETINKVREVAREMNYRPNRAAQAVRKQRMGTIAFLAPNCLNGTELTNYLIYPFLVGANHFLITRKFHLLLMEIDEFPAKQAASPLDEAFADGFIVHFGIPQYICEEIIRTGIPTVWWDSNTMQPMNCINRNEYEVGYRITRELLDLGHRRIAFYGYELEDDPITNPGCHYSSRDRYRGYCHAMEEAGLPVLVIERTDVEGIRRNLLAQRPTAVITLGSSPHCGPAEIAHAAATIGLKVPDQLSIASCDLEARIRPAVFQIGGMTYDRFQTGWEAAQMLFEIIGNNGKPTSSRSFSGEFRLGHTIAEAPSS
ncbi:MAG: LacI family transcriptional regulator [Lentisphaerae bacterium]|nr:MAG: LacI family transcriptional regulator [Lentisphaerota bacterium]